MKVLWYQSQAAKKAEKLTRLLEGISTDHDCRFADSICELAKSLKMPGQRPQAAVLLVADREELNQLVTVSEDFKGVRTIILLPDLEPDTIGSALCLRPSYYASNSSEPGAVRSVLEKIAAHTQ